MKPQRWLPPALCLALPLAGMAWACPELRLDDEYRLQACVREGVRLGLFRSAHDTAEGGLLVAALESAFAASTGCQLMLGRGGLRLDSLLFGESASRVVVSVSPDGEAALKALCETHRVPFAKIGVTGGTRFALAVDGVAVMDADAADLRAIHEGTLPAALEHEG